MGAISLHLSNRAGTIRRVVRVSGRFVCGICRRSHGEAPEAQDCVRACWEELLTLDPVIVRFKAFRCRFCARDHQERKKAYRCAEDCRTKQLRLSDIEDDLDEEDDGPERRKFKPRSVVQPMTMRPAARPAPRAVKSQAASGMPNRDLNPISVDVAKVATPAPAPAPVEAAPAAEPAGEADGGGGAAGKKAKKKSTGHMYYRDGARYVCQECNAKYFTKDEVEKCFSSHV